MELSQQFDTCNKLEKSKNLGREEKWQPAEVGQEKKKKQQKQTIFQMYCERKKKLNPEYCVDSLKILPLNQNAVCCQ